ncbi:2-pyrone-4,6-dicarboxylate hydrolase [Paraburkholderia guartelaensis]|uniref:2-pyrone-4,6-dicarboxylate hydrolase n=1 Tax=Paraburkholderia guartelaensis TaxID=2546446 RepID=A0A4R5L526_9BURK|nr:amidohydrolase family protein [Paraburkholderia guartelaensis]TDG02811.1 2-pyrone-4,6-dicarboxylate hydrolase [Paraburkholderia guartelaensis]
MDREQHVHTIEAPRARGETPAFACDSHIHIYDRRFAASPGNGAHIVDHATVEDYRRVQERTGTQRTVIVTPRPYGTDNCVTLDAIRQLGIDNARGVAVLRPDVSDAELDMLDRGGIRGIRFTLYTPHQAVVTFDMVEPLSRRIAELGWHVQLHWTADQIVEHEALLTRLPCKMVFDHLARLPLPAGVSHPAYGVVRRLAASGRVWVKLSGAYLDSQVGLAGGYADLADTARAWAALLPERAVWGSDWPHVTETHKPDTAAIFDLLGTWVEGEAARKRILVDNPAELYGFAR